MKAHRAVRWLAACLLLPAMAWAHKSSDAYLQHTIDGDAVEQRVDIALRDLDRELVLDADNDGQLQWREVVARWPDIARLAVEGAALSAAGRPCVAGPASAPALDEHSDGRHAVIVRSWRCGAAVSELAIDYRLFAGSDATHRGIARTQRGDRLTTAVLVPGAGVQPVAEAAGTSGFTGLFREGIHHILVGTDHVLFLLTLLLPAVLVRRPAGWTAAASARPVLGDVVKVVSAFTVAHSITLGLAVTGWLTPPSRWVESLIALSVVLAALDNLRPVWRGSRWPLAFGFGLVHGFGFAGALQALGLADGALGLSLLAFNLGVEAGQLAIVALFLPCAWALRHTRFYPRGVLPAGSVAIALLATVWLVERAFDGSIIATR